MKLLSLLSSCSGRHFLSVLVLMICRGENGNETSTVNFFLLQLNFKAEIFLVEL